MWSYNPKINCIIKYSFKNNRTILLLDLNILFNILLNLVEINTS